MNYTQVNRHTNTTPAAQVDKHTFKAKLPIRHDIDHRIVDLKEL